MAQQLTTRSTRSASAPATSCPAASTPRSARSARSAATRSSSRAVRGRDRDVDGNRYIDFVGSWGPLIPGTRIPRWSPRCGAAIAGRHELRRPDRGARWSSRRRSCARCRPSRWCASSTPAPRRR